VLNKSRTIDPYLVPALHRLPSGGESPQDASAASSLAVMNLKRGVKMRLPSGQDLAGFMGIENPLTPDEIATRHDGDVARAHGLDVATPLWFYILKEADLRSGGLRLGPLGSLIVAETFIGLLQGDPDSFLARFPCWRLGQPIPGLSPALPAEWAEGLSFADLVAEGAGGRTKEQLSPIG